MSDLELDVWWEPRDPAQADDARRLSQFVTGLPNFDPIYRSWLKSPKTKKETVPVPLSEAAAKQLLIDRVGQYDAPPGPWPELGSFIWGGHAGPPPYDFRKSSYADTWCHVGAFGKPESINLNDISMRLSDLPPSTGLPWRASESRPLMRFARDLETRGNVREVFVLQPAQDPRSKARRDARSLRPRSPQDRRFDYGR
jgi:hypothetical protein